MAVYSPAKRQDFAPLCQFYACWTGITFWGCCKANPCIQGGCPDGDLDPAMLNREGLRSAHHAALESMVTSTTISLTASSSTGDVSMTGSPVKITSSDGPSVVTIASGAAGGAFGLVIIIGLLVYYLCIRKRSRRNQQQATSTPSLGYGNMNLGIHSHTDAPPSYTFPNVVCNLPHTSQSHTFSHAHQSCMPEPQEPPNESVSIEPVLQKSVVDRFPTLEDEMAIKSELWDVRTVSCEKYSYGLETRIQPPRWSDEETLEYDCDGETREKSHGRYHRV